MYKLIYKLLSFLPACTLALLSMACAEERDLPQQRDERPTLESTVNFSGFLDAPSSRTSGKYGIISGNDLGITFYWTPNDFEHMYINKGTDTSPNWEKAIGQHWNDKDATTHSGSASFQFKGVYPNEHYTLLYVGGPQTSPSKDKKYVTFAKFQRQATPNDGEMANSGDCGVAITSKEWYYKNGAWGAHGERHNFVLQHKAAYVTLLPYNPRGNMGNTFFYNATFKADQGTWGTFPFSKDGVDLSARINNKSHRTVTLDLTQNGKISGLPIAENKEKAREHAGILVMPPGKYTNVEIRFNFQDPKTNSKFSVRQSYPALKLEAGANQPVFAKLNILDFSPSFPAFCMWGAQLQYYTEIIKAPRNWEIKSGVGKIPAPKDNTWPQGPGPRWYSDEETAPPGVGTEDAPDPNEASFILAKDCYWDDDALWAFDGHVFKGLMWVPILTGSHLKGVDGKDWTTIAQSKSRAPLTIPHPKNGYIPLPTLGRYMDGALIEVGKIGYYWIDGANPNDPEEKAYYIKVSKDGVSIHPDGEKKWGCLPFTGD